MRRHADRIALLVLLLIAACAFFAGINWGLPSRASDPYLFGTHAVWDGRQIIALAGGWEENPNLGADVALNPLLDRDRVLTLNDTDRQRAEIVRRYRLFSYQPDEMITLRALSGMKPARLQLDPKLYQYGGLWIYPIGGLLQIASRLHLVQLRGDVAYYLDHPEQFGRFYVVARFYTAIWALAGVWAVYALVRRILGEAGGWFYPAAAAACFIAMPVVMNMAHEAKPHLPGAVLMLLAVLAASRYVETGGRRWWMAAGALCGAALGMVLSSLPIFGILPVMVLLRWWHVRMHQARRECTPQTGRLNGVEAGTRTEAGPHFLLILVASGLLGAIVYLATNPYVPINLIRNRAVLQSNFGNSTAMYHAQVTGAGIWNAIRLIAIGTAPLLAIAGLMGAALLAARAFRVRRDSSEAELLRRAVGLLLAVPALWVTGQCVLLATGKPAEFGRFAIFPDVVLLIEAVVAIATFVRHAALARLFLAILFVTTAIPGALYLRAFVRDGRSDTSRLHLAASLAQMQSRGATSLAVFAEPAPYCQPPVDLWRWKLLLMPRDVQFDQGKTVGDVSIRTVDVPRGAGTWGWIVGTPISWASKPFEISSRHDVPSASAAYPPIESPAYPLPVRGLSIYSASRCAGERG